MGAKKAKNLVLADDNNSRFLRAVSAHPIVDDRGHVLVPRRWIKLVDAAACMVFNYKVWGSSGYGALKTRVLHRWNVRSVLRRAGVR